MSEELLLNDRRGNLIKGAQPKDQFFFMGANKVDPVGIRTIDHLLRSPEDWFPSVKVSDKTLLSTKPELSTIVHSLFSTKEAFILLPFLFQISRSFFRIRTIASYIPTDL